MVSSGVEEDDPSDSEAHEEGVLTTIIVSMVASGYGWAVYFVPGRMVNSICK
jgi:hypothetical protein